jgi:hypothetical protein
MAVGQSLCLVFTPVKISRAVTVGYRKLYVEIRHKHVYKFCTIHIIDMIAVVYFEVACGKCREDGTETNGNCRQILSLFVAHIFVLIIVTTLCNRGS